MIHFDSVIRERERERERRGWNLALCYSDSEHESSTVVQRTDSVRTQSSYKLLEENMDLLKKLTMKEDICR